MTIHLRFAGVLLLLAAAVSVSVFAEPIPAPLGLSVKPSDASGGEKLRNKGEILAELEAYLQKHPDDADKREEALRQYGRREINLERLKHHTFEMIEYHPSQDSILDNNTVAFYMDRQYALDAMSRLEAQVNKGHNSHQVCWMMAYIAKRLAVPPQFEDPAERHHFLSYFGLPEDTAFPAEPDLKIAEKSIKYYRLAIEKTQGDSFYPAFYAEQLGDLLMKLERLNEAIAVFETALPKLGPIAKANFLVSYGACLKEAGRTSEAKRILKQVRKSDKEGSDDGPAHATTRAENLLGEIALDSGNVGEACRYLLSSCHVQRCCHNTTQGLPLRLAKRLLKEGKRECVSEYCRCVLTKFAEDEQETQSVLQQALKAEEADAK